MTRGKGGERVVAVMWAVIAEVCLVGVGTIWLYTTAGTRAGYGRIGSVTVVAVAILLTLVAAVVDLNAARIRRAAQLVFAVVLMVVAGVVVPLVITDLVTGPGVDIPLALAVAGMMVLATHLIRTARSPSDEGNARDR
jgi:hypothetical protein